jgi:hypothetical protein
MIQYTLIQIIRVDQTIMFQQINIQIIIKQEAQIKLIQMWKIIRINPIKITQIKILILIIHHVIAINLTQLI